jgi:hypothetical protein
MRNPAFLGQVPLAQTASHSGTEWWIHHIANTRALAEAALSGDEQGALVAVRELWKAVKEWERMTGSWAAGVLMGEHTVLAKLLVDIYAQKKGDVSTAIDALMRNVDSQRKLFPKEPNQFADLFGPHTQLAGTYIADLADGRLDDFNAHFAQAISNGKELGAFTDNVILRKS